VFSDDKRTKLIVYTLIAAGIFVRFYFFFGHVYSDDAYYNYLAYTMYNGDFGSDYLGYPVCLVRIGQSFITAVSFLLFGPSEYSAAVSDAFLYHEHVTELQAGQNTDQI